MPPSLRVTGHLASVIQQATTEDRIPTGDASYCLDEDGLPAYLGTREAARPADQPHPQGLSPLGNTGNERTTVTANWLPLENQGLAIGRPDDIPKLRKHGSELDCVGGGSAWGPQDDSRGGEPGAQANQGIPAARHRNGDDRQGGQDGTARFDKVRLAR